MHSRLRFSGLTLLFFALSPLSAQTLRFSNATDISVPIEPTTVTLDQSGNVLAKCDLVNQQCPILAAPSGTAAPSQVSLFASATTIPAGTTISLSWIGVGATACASQGAPWAGLPLKSSGTHLLNFPQEGQYSLSLVCYSSGGARSSQSVSVTVVASTPLTPRITIFAGTPSSGILSLQTTLSWSTENTTSCQARSTGPAEIPAWTGSKPVIGTQSLSLTTQGMYTLDLVCSNASGVQTTKSITLAVNGTSTPPPGGGSCQEFYGGSAPADPQLEPVGWTRTNKTWVANWSAKNNSVIAVYPESAAAPVAFGASKGGYSVVGPFTPNANQVVRIYWELVQTNNQYGYSQPRPADAMWIGISPCPGDFRRTNNASQDKFLRGGCRRLASSDGIIFATLPGETDHATCFLQPGQPYYMNVIAANPEDGLFSGEHTCAAAPNSANGCDVQGNHRVIQ